MKLTEKERRWWSVSEASRYSGLPVQMLRMKMQAKECGRPAGIDIGIAVQSGSGKKGRWCYYIFPEKFKAWLGEKGLDLHETNNA